MSRGKGRVREDRLVAAMDGVMRRRRRQYRTAKAEATKPLPELPMEVVPGVGLVMDLDKKRRLLS